MMYVPLARALWVATNSTNSSSNAPPPTSDHPLQPGDGVIELSRNAAFALITLLALALAYHPASGSLIFGPTARFWLVSPIASIADTIAILLRLGEYVAWDYGLAWPYDTASGVSNNFSFRNAAYSIFIARSLNATKARRDEYDTHQQQNDTKASIEAFEAIGVELQEGIRFRVGVAFPIIAQFIKIVAVRAIYFPKVLGYIYFILWVAIEVLISLAQPKRSDPFTVVETEDILIRVDELLFLSSARNGKADSDIDEDAKHNTMFDNVFFKVYRWGFLASISVMIYFASSHQSRLRAQIGYISIAGILIFASEVVLSLRCELQTARNRALRPRLVKIRRTVKYEMAILSSMKEYGGPNVGGDGGTVFFVAWIVWCILCFNGKGTQRPDWPWLDWLG